MKTLTLSLLSSMLIAVQMQGQLSKNFKDTYLEAEFAYIMEDYPKALKLFEGLLDADPKNHNLLFYCGDCCLKKGGDNTKAVRYLGMATEDVNPNYQRNSYKEHRAPPESYLLLARSYHGMNKFDEAITNYENYRDSTGNRKFSEVEFVNRQIKSCELAMSLIQEPLKVRFTDLDGQFNMEFSASHPVVSGNDSMLIYTLEQPNYRSVMMSTQVNEGWTKPAKINVQLGISGDFNPVCLSHDGTELFLVKRDYYDSQLYFSIYNGKSWSRATELPKNINSRYHETHASLSKDGQRLYFVSDRKGGYGGLDIYCSGRDPQGYWGEPVNLGATVNTLYNEDTPFITANDRKLYFSSSGHQTMGGYDIFMSDLDESDVWQAPRNLGYPINTCRDDLFYNPGWTDTKAYYAWRVEGQTMSQLKNIVILPSGTPDHRQPVHPAVPAAPPDSFAEIMFPVSYKMDRDGEYIQDNTIEKKAPIMALPSAAEYMTLNSILFDFDDYRLNDQALKEVERIRQVLMEIPEATITLTGHTDSRGSDSYNQQLSILRAQSVGAYLAEGGVSPSRIKVKGIGESKPIAINKYEDGTDAPKGRLLNRHTSIELHNLPGDQVRVRDIFVPEWLKPEQDRRYYILLTQNEHAINKMPDTFFGKEICTVQSKTSMVYYVRDFKELQDAMVYLNNAIDYGFPEARIMETEDISELELHGLDYDIIPSGSYTVQIMALRRERDASYFSKLGMVMKFDGNDGYYRYTLGRFNSRDEALNEMVLVRKKGFRNAFVTTISKCRNGSADTAPTAVLAENRITEYY